MWTNKLQTAAPSSPAVNEPGTMTAIANPAPSNRPSSAAARDMAYLGASLVVKGDISGEEDLQIDGTVQGPITLQDKRLTVGRTAHLKSKIVAREVVVFGEVTGDLQARDRIEIKKNGSVVGNLTTARIMIEDGAYFKGAIEIARRASPAIPELETVLAQGKEISN